MPKYFRLEPENPQKLIKYLLEIFATRDCWVSFEGDLSSLNLESINGAKADETCQLLRHTIWPKQDFRVIPVTQGTLVRILGIIDSEHTFSFNCTDHFQIELEGQLAFGSYDNLDTSCFFAFSPISREELATMKESGIITRYAEEGDNGS